MSPIGFQELSQLAGGIVLFLFGLHLASDNLKAVAGARLKVIIKLLTANRMLGLFAGLFGTVLVQSNTATAVILVGLCQAGILTMARSIGVLLGANLGSTVTIQVVAFDLYAYALLVIAVGFIGTLSLSSKSLKIGGGVIGCFGLILLSKDLPAIGSILAIVGFASLCLSLLSERKAAGRALIGLGLIFVGMKVIKVAMAVMKDSPSFAKVIVDFQAYPLLVIAAAFLFTVLTNSSTATLGTAIALVAAGGSKLISPEGAVAIVMGAHLGSCPMALLSGTGTGRIGRQVSSAHVFIKVAGVVVVFPFLSQFAHYLTAFNSWMGASPSRAIANTHTLFNLINVVTLLPFTPQIAALLDWVIPEKKRQIEGILQHISDEQMEYRPLAMESAELEIKRLAFMVRGLLRAMEEAFTTSERSTLAKFKELDDKIDGLFDSILTFLTKMGQERLGSEMFHRAMTLVYVLTSLESIGDRVSKDFRETMRKRIEMDVQFSFEGLELLQDIHRLVIGRMDDIIQVLGEGEKELLTKVLDGQKEFHAKARILKKAHFKQLVKGVQEAEDTSMLYLDTLATMRNINQSIVDIAVNLHYSPYYGQSNTEQEGMAE